MARVTSNEIIKSILQQAKLLQLLLVVAVVNTGSIQAVINGTAVSENEWRSVVMLELLDPDNGRSTTCTGVIISDSYLITTASCVIHEETAKQAPKVKVCIGNKRPFNGTNQSCFSTNQIFTHHNFINNAHISTADNLAYIKIDASINLSKLKLQPAIAVTPDELSQLVTRSNLPEILWVGFDSDNINSREKFQGTGLGVKRQGTVTDAEFDYQSRAIVVKSTITRPGKQYQGMASFVRNKSDDWRLIGLVSQSSPDNLVDFDPELNPCDEDPIHVPHPKPILQASTTITTYPVAACGMIGFVKLDGFDELSCKKLLLRNLDWAKAIKNENPVALRQKAMSLYESNQSTDDAGEIYKLLYMAVKAGDKDARINLSRFLLEGKLFSRDIEQARQLLEDMVKPNHPTATLLIAKLMLFPENNTEIMSSTENRDKQIFSLLEYSANSGLAEAQYLIARLYQLGIGVEKSQTNAFNWYAIAAMQGHADSQFQLAMHWNDGRGVRPYQEAALFWLQQAAAQGQLAAQNRLGLLKPVVGN